MEVTSKSEAKRLVAQLSPEQLDREIENLEGQKKTVDNQLKLFKEARKNKLEKEKSEE